MKQIKNKNKLVIQLTVCLNSVPFVIIYYCIACFFHFFISIIKILLLTMCSERPLTHTV